MSPLEAANEIVMDLIFTKSAEWEYENEIRLAIPGFISEGTNAATLGFAPNELVAVYLGCRIDATDRQEIIELARRLREGVELYQAHVSLREYTLVFDPF
jgi:hypothetical protein